MINSKTQLKIFEIRRSLIKEIEDMEGNIDLYDDESEIDGWFTSAQLRKIADVMDKLRDEIKLLKESE